MLDNHSRQFTVAMTDLDGVLAQSKVIGTLGYNNKLCRRILDNSNLDSIPFRT